MNAAKFVEKIEGSKISVASFVLGFFAIVFFRNLLEGLVEVDKAILPFSNFFHFTVFYVSLFLTYTIVLKVFSSQRIEKTSKAVLAFWWLLLLVFLIDLFASLGKGFRLTYLFGSPAFIAENILFYGWHAVGTSIGQKIVVATALVLAAAYTWIKTNSALRSIAAALFLYILTALYTSVPALIVFLLHGSFEAQLVPQALLRAQILFIALAALQLFAWLWFFDRSKAVALLKNLQPLRLFHYLLMAFCGLLVFQSVYAQPADLLGFAAAIAAGFFAFQASVAFNDLSDSLIDKKTGKRTAIQTKRFSRNSLFSVAFFESFIALAFALSISFQLFALIASVLLLSWVYSMNPFRAKRFPLISTLVLALISLLALYAGFFAAGAKGIALFPWNFSLLVIVFVSFGFNAKDLKDLEGDRMHCVCSLPVLFGEEKSRRIISLLIALAYLSAFALTAKILLLPFALFFSVFSHFLLTKLRTGEVPLLLAYFAFAAIFGLLVFQ